MSEELKKFEDNLQEYIQSKRAEMHAKYNRVLPTNELFYDRWQKAKDLKFGENSNIYDTSIVMGNVKVGKNVWIGPYTLLDGVKEEIEIGDWCTISTGVLIFTHDSTKYYLTSGKQNFQQGKVKIGNNTQIGSMSMISHGVTIGHHCVIGANSFVKSDIPDFSIAVGTPAKVIGRVVLENDDVRLEYN